MAAPYEFVNVTKKQYYQYHSDRLDFDGVVILLSLFKSGIWEPKDDIVHGHQLLKEDEKFVYYDGEVLEFVDFISCVE